MNNRTRTLAVLNYEPYDRLPLVHFGYWTQTLDKWAAEGHVTLPEAQGWADGNAIDAAISGRLGFDFGWSGHFSLEMGLLPVFEKRVLATLPDGSRHVVNEYGVVILEKDGAAGIPPELEHLLKGRAEWQEYFLPRLQFTPERAKIDQHKLDEFLQQDVPRGIYGGSLYGKIRDWVGLVQLAYLQVDDPALYDEMIEAVGALSYQCLECVLETGVQFDHAHFWEDICFKTGPLINPRVFREKVGPQYRRITDLLHRHGIHLVSVDCDGQIDTLIPIWLENGVNIMFPIEVGTWQASIKPWREKYGPELRGVGGMDKRVFAYDYAAIDAEIERLKPLVELGGYIPCPDHRLAPDAKWENVQYYCERMRKVFG